MSNRKKMLKTLLISIILILLIALPLAYYNIKDPSIKSLLLSIISSIIASIIYQTISETIFTDKANEIEALRDVTETLSEKEMKGILKIQGRSEYETKFWKSLLVETNKNLILSGRTLNRWLESNIKDDFVIHLKRILQGKESSVSLIIYKDLPNDNEKREKENLHNFLDENIFPICVTKNGSKVKKKKNVNLSIYEVDILPYLYTSNENKIIIAPYFKYVDNGSNIMFVLGQDCKYGTAYSKDFNYIISNAHKCTWFSDYIKKCEEEIRSDGRNKKI